MLQQNVQKKAHSNDVEILPADAHKITLAIVQDFPKKQADKSHTKNVEMI